MKLDLDILPDDLRVRFYRSSRFPIFYTEFPVMYRRPFTLIATVEQGLVYVGYDRNNHKTLELREGDVVICPANIWRHARAKDGTILEASYMFELKGGMDLLTFAGKPFVIKGQVGEQLKNLLHELCESEHEPDNRSSLMKSVSRQRYGYAILECILSVYTPTQEMLSMRQIYPVIDYMEKTYTQPLQIEKLIRLSGYSRTHFFRVFKTMTGKTPVEFQKQSRLRQAMLLLKETDKTVAEIADKVGWEDPFHFSKLFKKEVGMPPSLYRDY